MEAIRRTLAKRSNQRLVRLERATSKVSGESYATYGAAQIAYDYILSEASGFRSGRFKETLKTGKTKGELKREITALQGFLSAKSSTVRGQREIEDKRTKTFMSGEYGKAEGGHAGITPNKSFYNFLNSNTYSRLKAAGFDSEKIVDFYGRYKGKLNHQDIMKTFKKALDDYEQGEAKVSIKDLDSRLMEASNSKALEKARKKKARTRRQNNAARHNKKK